MGTLILRPRDCKKDALSGLATLNSKARTYQPFSCWSSMLPRSPRDSILDQAHPSLVMDLDSIPLSKYTEDFKNMHPAFLLGVQLERNCVEKKPANLQALCFWERHLAVFLNLFVADRWWVEQFTHCEGSF